MKSFEFDESMLGDMQGIAAKLFGDENDPRSFAYKRVHIRPAIHWWKIVLYCLIEILVIGAAVFACLYFSADMLWCILAAAGVWLVWQLLDAKRIIITWVQIYQRYAPDSLRNKCRYEPSCSQYMVLAVEKYGAFRGLIKGIGRLKRCNINNGGFEMP